MDNLVLTELKAKWIQVHVFRKTIFEPNDMIEIRILPQKLIICVKAERLGEYIVFLNRLNNEGGNVYLGANPRMASGGSRSQNVALARTFFVDYDGVSVSEAKIRSQKAGLPTPTLVIDSGHGVHIYWRLKEPMTDLAEWTARQKSLIKLLGSDPVVHDPPRVMRLPGFQNTKAKPWVPCQVIEFDPDFAQVFPVTSFPDPVPFTKAAPEVGNSKSSRNSRGLHVRIPGAYERAQAYLSKLPPAIEGHGGDHQTFKAASVLINDFALSQDEALVLMEEFNSRCIPPWSRADLLRKLQNAGDYSKREQGNKIARSQILAELEILERLGKRVGQ